MYTNPHTMARLSPEQRAEFDSVAGRSGALQVELDNAATMLPAGTFLPSLDAADRAELAATPQGVRYLAAVTAWRQHRRDLRAVQERLGAALGVPFHAVG